MLTANEKPSDVLRVFDIGATVTIGNGIQAKVTAVSVRANRRVCYEVAWWDGADHTCKYLEDFEVSGAKESLAIGFL